MKDVVSIVGVIGALTIGSLGLSTWRKQLRGTSEYELGKRAVLAAYQIKNLIQAVRDPFVFLNKEKVEAGDKLEEEQRIYNDRLRNLFSGWAGFETTILECKVIWGGEAEQRFQTLKGLAFEMRAAIWMHLWLEGAYAPGQTIDQSPERVDANRALVYRLSNDADDEFSQRINKAVERVEDFFKDKITRNTVPHLGERALDVGRKAVANAIAAARRTRP